MHPHLPSLAPANDDGGDGAEVDGEDDGVDGGAVAPQVRHHQSLLRGFRCECTACRTLCAIL